MKARPPSTLRPGNLHPVRALMISCRGAGKGLHFGEHQAHSLLWHPDGEVGQSPGEGWSCSSDRYQALPSRFSSFLTPRVTRFKAPRNPPCAHTHAILRCPPILSSRQTPTHSPWMKASPETRCPEQGAPCTHPKWGSHIPSLP